MDPKKFMNPSVRFPQPRKRTEAFQDFNATQLFCPRCNQAVPVRKRLLLVLPEGDKYEYLCVYCSATVGTKIDREKKPLTIIA